MKAFKGRAARIIIVIIALLVSSAALAEEETLTLEEALGRALVQNHYVKAKEYGVQATRYELASATSAFFPRLFFEEKLTRGDYNSYAVFARLNQETLTFQNFLSPGTVTNYQSAFTAEMPVFVRELFVGREMKRLSFLAKSREFDRFREEIALTTIQTYLSVVKSGALKNVAAESLEQAREFHRVATARVRRGTGLHSDELRAFVNLKERQAQVIRTDNDHANAKMALGLILSETRPFNAAPSQALERISLPPMDEALRDAPEQRTDYLSDKHQTDQASSAVSLQKSRLFPKVQLSASYATDSRDAPFGSGGEGYVVGVGLRWELFDKTLHDDIQRAWLEQMRSAEYLAQKKKEIGFQIHESYRKVTETKNRVEVARDAVEQARESLRLIQLRYQNGLSTLVELLDAQVAMTSAETNLIVAGTDFQEAAAKALFNSGTLLVTLQPWLERNEIPNPKHQILNDGRDDK